MEQHKGHRLFMAGVKTSDDGAVTQEGNAVGTVWKDEAGWWWGADGRTDGPYPNQTTATWELYRDYVAEPVN